MIRRMGRFHVTFEAIETNPEGVMRLFGVGVIVLEATSRWDRQAVEYLAICHQFAEVSPQVEAPCYIVVPDGEGFRFERERFNAQKVNQ